jgi:hypothetical protein
MRWKAIWLLSVAAIAFQRNVRASDPHDEDAQNPLRLELRPYGGWAFVPHSVVGAFIGADATVRVHRRWALGADGAWYSPFESAPSASVAPYPLNRTSWSASLDVAFFPLLPARTTPAAGSLEAFVRIGVGVVAARPIAVVDPSRHFTDSRLVQLGAGVGGRMYINRWLAATLELRDAVYFDRVENPRVAEPPFSPSDPGTWYSPHSRLTNRVERAFSSSDDRVSRMREIRVSMWR